MTESAGQQAKTFDLKKWKWWIIAAIALSLIKIEVQNPKDLSWAETEIKIGLPWKFPIDSLQASCARSGEEMILLCAMKAKTWSDASSVTLFKVGPCQACYNLSLSLSSIGRSRQRVEYVANAVSDWIQHMQKTSR